ncbi:hypothetical protein SAMN05660209_00687 [Geodermatophilus africanus]|uniref:Uncharacterized protein n=1 Tax=Geodermatophilus africanus TaxID=1137993 RepID=A0A1H3CNJ2_9ACTN|nr:hypothetical protein SAMN05660209_00687 [Geodermatophilus africanus]
MLPGDPTVAAAPGRFARATWTPDGPGTVSVTWQPGGPEARVEAHGLRAVQGVGPWTASCLRPDLG